MQLRGTSSRSLLKVGDYGAQGYAKTRCAALKNSNANQSRIPVVPSGAVAARVSSTAVIPSTNFLSWTCAPLTGFGDSIGKCPIGLTPVPISISRLSNPRARTCCKRRRAQHLSLAPISCPGLMQVGLKFIQCKGSNVVVACWAVAEAVSLDPCYDGLAFWEGRRHV